MGTLTPGSAFGELALIHNVPRAATIRCCTPAATLWSVDRATFRNVLLSASSTKLQDKIQFLRRVNTFESLNDDQISKLGEAVKQRRFNGGMCVTWLLLSSSHVPIYVE